MLTYAALTTLTDRDRAQALADAMETLTPAPTGVGMMEVEDGSGLWEIGAYFPAPPDIAGLALLALIHDSRPFAVSEVPDQDWVAKVRRDLPPVAAGRFVVHGSHDMGAVPADKIGLLIDAAMAFGTGHHGTTLGCLRALDMLLTDGVTCDNVIDVGCGTAVLAMAAAKVWPGAVMASDNDPIAVDVAAANVAANGLAGRVPCVLAEGFDAPDIAAAGPFDLVFANILKGPLIALAPDMAAHLRPGGRVILSGILVEQADDVTAVYARHGFNLAERQEIVDWATMTLVKSV